MSFTLGGRRVRVDLGHLLFILAVAGWCFWYLLDARASSTNLQNLLLIQPAVIIALLLALLIARKTVHLDEQEAAPRLAVQAEATDGGAQAAARGDDARDVLRVFFFMVLLGVYLVLIPRIGIDVATFLFVGACLIGQGERRPHFVIGIPLIFTAVMVYGFKALLPIPIPTLLG